MNGLFVERVGLGSGNGGVGSRLVPMPCVGDRIGGVLGCESLGGRNWCV